MCPDQFTLLTQFRLCPDQLTLLRQFRLSRPVHIIKTVQTNIRHIKTMFSNFKTQLITLRMFRTFPDNLAQQLVYSD
jgi:hypothetical protein